MKGKVVYVVYKHSDVYPMNNEKEFPEAVVVQFHSVTEGVEYFLEGVHNNVEIPVVPSEWRISTKYFIRKKFLIILLGASAIHKS